jgi:hypothetical protein
MKHFPATEDELPGILVWEPSAHQPRFVGAPSDTRWAALINKNIHGIRLH